MTKDMFHFVNEFEKLHNVRRNVRVYMLKDQIQKTETDTCGIFQLQFYDNLFGPQYSSAIISHEDLTKNIVQALLNEIFSVGK